MDYSFIREEINSENSNNYVLSILLSQDGFYFYVAGKESIYTPVQFISRRFDKTSIESLIRELESFKEFDNLIFHKSVVIYHTDTFSLVPGEFYSSEYQDGFVNLLHLKKDNTNTVVSGVPGMNINIVFHIPERLSAIIESKFPHSSIIHSACPSLHFGFHRSEQSCIVNHFGSSISVTIFSENELKLYNIFPVQNENDLIYYISLTLRSCNMMNQETSLYFLGDKDKDSNDCQMISRYINKPVSYAPLQNVTDELNFPPGMLFNHLEALPCVS